MKVHFIQNKLVDFNSWDSSVGRAVDHHATGPRFNTCSQLNLAGLTQPSIPLWVGKVSTNIDGEWRNNVHSK